MNSISKRFISITAMGAVVLSSFTCALATDHESDGIIKIYFTNDVHCAYENYARAASIIGDKDLLIDAGDNIQGDIIGTISDGGYMVDIMNYMGYDAAVPGNHEFDYGIDRFFEIVRGSDDVPKLADCDYISCNFRDIGSGEPVLEPYKIYEAEGKKVAVVGISTPETLTKSNPANLKNEDGEWIYDFSNDKTGEILYETVQSAVDSAREQDVDYVIAVGHLGTDEESEPWTSADIIKNTTGIDAFIDGHSHEAYTASVKNENGEEIPVAQTGTKLENIGCMTIDEEGGISAQLIKIDENIAEDSKTKEFIDGIAAEIEDIKNEVDWFFDAVLYASQNGIMQGINDDQFSPYSEVTRAMAVTVLHRMTEGSAGSKSSSFSDVDENAYYALAVDWASENGIVNGYSDTVFAPDDAVTREQLALILYRYAILTGRDISLNGNLSAFADCENISDYAYEAVEWANGNELINGNGDGTINPTGKTTRAELASILMRYSEAE